MYARKLNAYKKVHLETASPARMLDELFARCLRDLDECRAFIASKDVVKKSALADHALAIIGELDAALDHSTAPDLCRNLAGVYAYAREQVIAGSAQMSPEPIDRASSVLRSLREGFASV
jgi:flagellar biosynthetic protein FliS